MTNDQTKHRPLVNGIATPQELCKAASDLLLAVAEGHGNEHGRPTDLDAIWEAIDLAKCAASSL
jgi:hypothetical protein